MMTSSHPDVAFIQGPSEIKAPKLQWAVISAIGMAGMEVSSWKCTRLGFCWQKPVSAMPKV